MMDPDLDNCEGCKFWSDAGNDTGECRRYPPMILQPTSLEILSITTPDVVDEQIERLSRWPIVDASDWCGEWKKK